MSKSKVGNECYADMKGAMSRNSGTRPPGAGGRVPVGKGHPVGEHSLAGGVGALRKSQSTHKVKVK